MRVTFTMVDGSSHWWEIGDLVSSREAEVQLGTILFRNEPEAVWITEAGTGERVMLMIRNIVSLNLGQGDTDLPDAERLEDWTPRDSTDHG